MICSLGKEYHEIILLYVIVIDLAEQYLKIPPTFQLFSVSHFLFKQLLIKKLPHSWVGTVGTEPLAATGPCRCLLEVSRTNPISNNVPAFSQTFLVAME